MSEQSKALAESICVLFGKAYKRDGNPAQGGIEDKVLSDVIMLIDGMLRAHYGPMVAERDEALNLRDQYEARALAAEEGERRMTAERAALRAALESIANHPTGWPPPEEENASMRGIASAALASGEKP